jgi:hypothetical protein
MRRIATGGIEHPHFGQVVLSDAITFSKLIFCFRGTRKLSHGSMSSLFAGEPLTLLSWTGIQFESRERHKGWNKLQLYTKQSLASMASME